ncbi:helix-turn-helix domain-containing protein [Candidatus Paracaedibacter symbiosus]|uniref:helix-turn-helix domain-containing protein n=1 Tax=Candidatus Paracaedibacter symbiosus TaxID=244582 RepID=UPI00068CB9CE|nr:helix-turn-helix transcriptional regulator [Candidatus Paracaedibacter symbiosus]
MSSENSNKHSFPIDVYIGKKLKQRRRLLGLKQYELAKMLGVTSQQIHKYEKGFDRISASRLLEIGKALSVPTCFFMRGWKNIIPKERS